MIVREHLTNCTNGTYYLVGEMLATMLIQEGEAPRFFARTIVNYMKASQAPSVDVSKLEIHCEDVPGMKGKALQEMLTESCSEEQFNELIGEYYFYKNTWF